MRCGSRRWTRCAGGSTGCRPAGRGSSTRSRRTWPSDDERGRHGGRRRPAGRGLRRVHRRDRRVVRRERAHGAAGHSHRAARARRRRPPARRRRRARPHHRLGARRPAHVHRPRGHRSAGHLHRAPRRHARGARAPPARAHRARAAHAGRPLRLAAARRLVPGPSESEDDMTQFLKIEPYLFYPDGRAALDWLQSTFGLGEISAYEEDGVVTEGSVAAGDSSIHLHGGGDHTPNGALTIITVDDVDALYEHIRSTGTALAPPKDESYGPRSIHVTDPWGYQWYFWQ